MRSDQQPTAALRGVCVTFDCRFSIYFPKRLRHDKWPVLLETLYDIFASQQHTPKAATTKIKLKAKTNKSRATSLNGQKPSCHPFYIFILRYFTRCCKCFSFL